MPTDPPERLFHVDMATEIAGSPEQVWQVLTSFDGYPQWNPAIRRVSGELKTGAKLRMTVVLFGFKQWNLRATVLAVMPNRQLVWEAQLLSPFFFLAKHIFDIEPLTAGRVMFRQSEQYKGLLAPVLARVLAPFTRRSFEQMNGRLRDLAERSSSHLDSQPCR